MAKEFNITGLSLPQEHYMADVSRKLKETIDMIDKGKHVAELKIWRGQVAHEEGLSQLADYLERLKLTEGYLIIFDHKEIKTWDSGWVDYGDKKIFVIWV